MNQETILLHGRNITQRWGGLVALDSVDVDLRQGEVHAVIGTNGAGKSTLINILSGELIPTDGQIELSGLDVTKLTQPRRALKGLGRSYQRNNIFPELTVLENCRLAAQAQVQRPWVWWNNSQKCVQSSTNAHRAVQQAGLEEASHKIAGPLSHGQKRQLEVAMCLATNPQVLLLDEPLAGMGAEETDRMLNLLRDLKQDHAILLVEHDMDAVFRIADRITVMVNGCVIATGTPDMIRNNKDVQTAYLGDH